MKRPALKELCGETLARQHPEITAKVAALLKSNRIPSLEFPIGLLDQP